MADNKQLLSDFVATAYKDGDVNSAISKFPELKSYDKKLLSDFVATAYNDGDVSSAWNKFPEFHVNTSIVPTPKEFQKKNERDQQQFAQRFPTLAPKLESSKPTPQEHKITQEDTNRMRNWAQKTQTQLENYTPQVEKQKPEVQNPFTKEYTQKKTQEARDEQSRQDILSRDINESNDLSKYNDEELSNYSSNIFAPQSKALEKYKEEKTAWDEAYRKSYGGYYTSEFSPTEAERLAREELKRQGVTEPTVPDMLNANSKQAYAKIELERQRRAGLALNELKQANKKTEQYFESERNNPENRFRIVNKGGMDINTIKWLEKDTEKTLKAPSTYTDSNGVVNFGKGISDTGTDIDTWSLGITEIARNLNIKNILEKSVKGQPLNPTEESVLANYFMNISAHDLRQGDMTTGYKAGQALAQSIPFMVEFGLTDGTGTAVSAAIKKSVGKVLGKYSENIVGRFLSKAAGNIAETTVRTALMPTTYAQMTETALQNRTQGKDYTGTDLLSDVGNAAVENLTEVAGGRLIDKGLDYIPGIKNINRLWEKNPIARAVAQNSPISEMGEEYLGGAINYLRSYMPYYDENQKKQLQSEIKQLFTPEGFKILAGSILPVSGMFGLYTGNTYRKINRNYQQNKTELQNFLKQNGETDESTNYIISSFENTSAAGYNENMPNLLESVAQNYQDKNPNATDDQVTKEMQKWGSALTRYLQSLNGYQTLIADTGKALADYQEKINEATDNATDFVNAITHSESGNVIEAKLYGVDAPINITKGNIVTKEDGTLDTENSDKIFFYKTSDGQLHIGNTEFIENINNVMPATQAIEESMKPLQQELQNENAPQYAIGSTVVITDNTDPVNPQNVMAQITGRNNDGTYRIQRDAGGGKIQQGIIEPREILPQFEGVLDNENAAVDYTDPQSGQQQTGIIELDTADKQIMFANGYAIIKGKAIPFENIIGVNSEQTTDNRQQTTDNLQNNETNGLQATEAGNAPEELGKDRNRQSLQESTDLATQAATESQEPRAKSQEELIPTDEKGNLLFEQARPELTIQFLQDNFEKEEIVPTVEARINAINKEISKQEAFKPTGNIQKDALAKQAKKQALSALNEQLGYWGDIKERVTPRNYKPKNETVLQRNTRWGEPVSLRELIIRKFIGGLRLRWEDEVSGNGSIISRGLGAEYRYDNNERKSHFSFISGNGLTPEQLAHTLWEANAYEPGQFEDMPLYGMDTQEILSEVLDVMNSYRSIGEMIKAVDEIRDQYSADEQAYIDALVNDAENQNNVLNSIENEIDDSIFAQIVGVVDLTEEQQTELQNIQNNVTNTATTATVIGSDSENGRQQPREAGAGEQPSVSGRAVDAGGNKSGDRGVEGVDNKQPVTPKWEQTPKSPKGDLTQAELDTQELDAYIASQEHNTNPTEKQKETGIYPKARVNLQGFNITLETLKGTERSGIDEGGQKWSVMMNNHYGELDGTIGYDGDPIDVFIGPNPKEGQIYVIDQTEPRAKSQEPRFDESKVMLGFDSAEEAKVAYLSNYEPGWDGFGAITPAGDNFKEWLYDGKKQRKPFSDYVGTPEAVGQIRFQIKSEELNDKKYFAAIERGDMEEAQRIVDQQAANNGYISANDYRDAHRAPGAEVDKADFRNLDVLREIVEEDGWDTNLYALANGISKQPDDYFSPRGARWYGYDNAQGNQSASAIRSAMRDIQNQLSEFGEVKEMPLITVYRAVQKSLKEGSIRNGDWVTPSLLYAKNHGKHRLGYGEYKIIKEDIPADNLWWDGNDVNEWGVDDGNGFAYKDTKNNKKLTDVIVRDDNGEIIPPSKRFNQRINDVRFQAVSQIGFYSTVESALDKIQQEKGSKEQFRAMLLKNGAKQAEMDWMGFDELPEKLTKADIQNWIEDNMIDVREVEKGNFDLTVNDVYVKEASVGGGWIIYRKDNDKRIKRIQNYEAKNEEDAKYFAINEYNDWNKHSNTKFSKYVLPGGENYKELLLTMPEKLGLSEKEKAEKETLGRRMNNEINMPQSDIDRYNELERKSSKRIDNNFKSSHFDEPNILAHVRFDEREVNGERVLFIEEFQSDWSQKIKKEGEKLPEDKLPLIPLLEPSKMKITESQYQYHFNYNNRTYDVGKGVVSNPIFAKEYFANMINKDIEHENDIIKTNNKYNKILASPFKKTDQWLNLAARRMMRYAAENGFDRIAWTTGEQQADRYDLAKQVDRIVVDEDGGKYSVMARPIGKTDLEEITVATKENLSDYIGKELATKSIEDGGGDFSGNDLKVGGAGMKAFYDGIVPAAMSKLGKPFGAKVETIDMPETGEQQSIPVTDSMKQSVMEGIPLFQTTSENSKKFDASRTAEEKYAAGKAIIEQLDAENGRQTEVVGTLPRLIELLPESWKPAALEIIKKGNTIGGVKIGERVVVNTEAHGNTDKLLLAYEHEHGHVSTSATTTNKELGELWNNVSESDKALVPKAYYNNPDWVKGDELISYAIEDIIEKQGYEAYKNGEIDLSSYSELLQRQLKKVTEHANKEFRLKAGRRNAERNNTDIDTSGKTIRDNGGTGNAGGDGRGKTGLAEQSAGDVQGTIPGRSAGVLQSPLNNPQGDLIKPQYTPGKSMVEYAKEVSAWNNRKQLPATIEVDGVERPTTNSNGKPIHSTEEGIRNFWRWFGDSKVVDENGRPLVVYHGTNVDFNEFKSISKRYFFTDNKIVAERYRNEYVFKEDNTVGINSDEYNQFKDDVIKNNVQIKELYLKIENPKIKDYLGSNWLDNPIENDIDKNKDGLIAKNIIGGASTKATTFIVFSPTQIKSATGNDGTFDSENADIRYQIIGEKGASALDAAQEATTRLDNLRVAKEMEEGKIENNNIVDYSELKGNQQYFVRLTVDPLKDLERGTSLHIGGEGTKEDAASAFDTDISNIKWHKKTGSWAQVLNGLAGYEIKSDNIEDAVEEARELLNKDANSTVFNNRIPVIYKGIYSDMIPDGDLFKPKSIAAYIAFDEVSKSGEKIPSKIYKLYNKTFDVKSIRLATGWEKGVDGLWRYEVADGKLREGWETGKSLKDVWDSEELYASYPGLASVHIAYLEVDDSKALDGSSSERWINNEPTIAVTAPSESELQSALIHEIQHQIQAIEGFGKGGSMDSIVSERKNEAAKQLGFKDEKAFDEHLGALLRESNALGRKWWSFSSIVRSEELQNEMWDLTKKYRNLLPGANSYSFSDRYKYYSRLSGEVESRNAQQRNTMNDEERRNTLLSETADVAPEDQIVLMDGMGVSKFAPKSTKGELPATIDINGVERPTSNSNGKPIHSTEEGIRNFWRWFGDSKVVDKDGRPLVVYHGSTDIEEAKEEFRYGFWTEYENAAKEFGDVISAYLKIEKVKEINFDGKDYNSYPIGIMKDGDYYQYNPYDETKSFDEFLNDFLDEKELSKNDIEIVYGEDDGSSNGSIDILMTMAQLSKNKYDGAIFKNVAFTGDNYIVFSPNQVKSATENTGEFDPEDTDIRFQIQGYKGSRTTPEYYKQAQSLDDLFGIGKPVHDKKGGEPISEYYKRVKAWSVANNPESWDEVDRQEVADFIAGKTPDSYEAKSQRAEAAATEAGATVLDEPKPVFQQDGHANESIGDFAKRVVAWREVRFINGIVRAEREAEARAAEERGDTPIDHEIARMQLDMELRTVYDSLGKLIGKESAKKLERFAGNKEMWADSLLPVKTFLEYLRKSGMKIPDIDNYYIQATALQGKNDTGFNNYVRKYQKPMNKWIKATVKATGLSYRDIENYVFLKHGVERNEYFKKDGKHQKADYAGVYAIAVELYAKENGIPFDPKEKNEIGKVLREYAKANDIILKESSEQGIYDELFQNKEDVVAQATVNKTLAYFDNIIKNYVAEFENESNGKGRSIDEFWQKLNAANDFSIDTMADGGIITREQAAEIKSRYRYFIPLRGHEVEAEKTYEYTPDAGVFFSNPAIKARGRMSRGESPFAYIAQMAQSSVVMTNKNNLNKTLLRLARRDKTGLLTTNKTWYIKTSTDAEGNDIWEEAEIEAKPFDELNRAEWEAWNMRMKELEKDGRARQFTKGVDLDGLFIKKKQKKQHAITVVENGEEYQVYINANPRISRAINGLNKSEQNAFYNFLSKTKGMIGLNITSRNPAFMAANFTRDTLFAASTLPAKEGGVYAAKYIANIGIAAKELAQYQINPDTAPDYVREFFDNGGETGYSHLWELQDMQKEVDKAVATGMSASKAWDAITMPIDVINKIVENTTRMAVYKTSRESGRTIERSVSDAKEVSLNFNRSGAGGGIVDFVRSAYLFVNAGVQALNNFTGLYKAHPWKMSAVVLGYAMSGLLMPLINSGAGDDDDEYWNLPEYERQNNLCIWTGSGFIKIPLPQELRVFYRMGDNIASMIWNKEAVGKAMVNTIEGMLDLIPAEPSGAVTVSTVELVPDAFKPFAQVYWSNQTFTGAAIAKDKAFMKEGVPQYRQVRTNRANEPKAPAEIIWLSATLNAALGGDQYRSAGAFEKEVLNPDRMNHLARGYFGGVYTTAMQGVGTITDRFYMAEKDLNEKTTGNNLQKAYDKIDEAEQRVNQFNAIVKDFQDGKIDSVQYAKDTIGYNFGEAKRIQKLGSKLQDINKVIKENQELPEAEMQQLKEAQKTILKMIEEAP